MCSLSILPVTFPKWITAVGYGSHSFQPISATGTCLPFSCCAAAGTLCGEVGSGPPDFADSQGIGCANPHQVLTTVTVWQGGRLPGTRWSQCFHPYWNQCCELSRWCRHPWVQCSCGSWTASRFGGIPQMRWDLWRRKAQPPQRKVTTGTAASQSPLSMQGGTPA